MADTPPILLDLPLAGRFLAQNSPANRVPSHGVDIYGQSHAIDLSPVGTDGWSARPTLRTWGVGTEPPERFIGFGRPVLAPASGTIVRAHGTEPDNPAYRGLASIGYMLTQGRRAAGGWPALAGNHVTIETPDGAFVTLCHLRHASLRVAVGDSVSTGQEIAACGNSGNTTEPHIHLQVTDVADPERARGVPFAFRGPDGEPFLPRNGEIVG